MVVLQYEGDIFKDTTTYDEVSVCKKVVDT